jgi:HlyD family secretion protein
MVRIVSLFLLALTFAGCKRNHEIIKPQRKTLMEAIYASGFVVARDEYQVFAQAEGYLSAKLVNDGDIVRQGDPLFIIEADQQSARYRIARENYDMALANHGKSSPVLKELMAAVDVAKTKMEFDSLNFVRYTNLLRSNATTRADYDRMKLQFDNSKNEYILQKSRLGKTQNQLYIELQNAKSQLQIAGDESGRYTVRSQIAGRVFKTMKERGELVRRNEAVAIVGMDDAFYLQLNVDELDVQRLKLGQRVLAKIDAYPGKVFEGRVSKIYPMINKQQQSIRVDADLAAPLPGNFSGLALEANIVIQEKQDALVIPKAVLLPGDSLNIKTEDGIKKIKIIRGIETLDEVEIAEGLDSAESLIVENKP